MLWTTFRGLTHRQTPLRWFSSRVSERLKVDPSTLVAGVTKERLDADEALAEYMRSNFPDAFEAVDDSSEKEEEIDFGNLILDPYEKRVAKRHDEKVRIRKERAAQEKDRVYPRNIRQLTSILRNPKREDGTRNCKRLRYDDKMVPGILYGGDPTLGIYSHQDTSKTWLKTPWPLLQRELDRYNHAFESRVYELTVKENMDDESGTVHLVTPQNVQRHPLLDWIYCANFLRYHPGRPLKLPIRYINEEESPALKREGFMIPILRFIECFVEEGADIPESIDLECAGILMRQVARKDRLIIPEGVRLSDRVLAKKDLVIGVVQGGGRDEEEAEENKDTASAKEDDKAKEAKAKEADKPKK